MGFFAKLFGKERLQEKKTVSTTTDHDDGDEVQIWQLTLDVGDFFISQVEVFGRPLTIYGEIVTDPTPTDKNQMFGKCYSAMCPHGELGYTHRSKFTTQISPRLFKEADKKGWPLLTPAQIHEIEQKTLAEEK